jgi:hypothetical protein
LLSGGPVEAGVAPADAPTSGVTPPRSRPAAPLLLPGTQYFLNNAYRPSYGPCLACRLRRSVFLRFMHVREHPMKHASTAARTETVRDTECRTTLRAVVGHLAATLAQERAKTTLLRRGRGGFVRAPCAGASRERRAAVGGLTVSSAKWVWGPKKPLDTTRDLCWNVGCQTGEAG